MVHCAGVKLGVRPWHINLLLGISKDYSKIVLFIVLGLHKYIPTIRLIISQELMLLATLSTDTLLLVPSSLHNKSLLEFVSPHFRQLTQISTGY